MEARFNTCIAESRRLSAVVDPEDEPYRSKYASRKLLQETRAVVMAERGAEGDQSDLEQMAARLDYRIGVNYLNTEENSDAEKCLMCAGRALDPEFERISLEACSSSTDTSSSAAATPPVPPSSASTAKIAPIVAVELMDTYNHLGMLWSGRSEGAKVARVFLSRSEAIYDATYNSTTASDANDTPKATSSQADVTKSALTSPANEDGSLDPEALRTLTLFYLAQVHAALGNIALAAEYCHGTVRRQLRLGHSFETLRWARDVLGLSRFYAMQGDVRRATHCICAARLMVGGDGADAKDGAATDPATPSGPSVTRNNCADEEEEYTKLGADAEVELGKLHLEALREAHLIVRFIPQSDAGAVAAEEKDAAACCEELSSVDMLYPMPGDGAASTDDAVTAACSKGVERAASRAAAERRALPPAPHAVRDFEAARAVFKTANACFERAKKYYVLDGFVTDRVHLLQYQSKLYKYLAAFEGDAKRRAAMQQRREGLLSALLEELNPKHYETEHKEVSFELGEACQELLDAQDERAKAAAARQRGPTAESRLRAGDVKRVNEAAAKSIKYFRYFADLYKDREGNVPDPKNLDDDTIVGLLMAKFCIARVVGRQVGTGRAEKVEHMKESLRLYEQVLRDAAAAGPAARDSFKAELAICKEMVELLPSKINHMHFLGSDFSR